MTNKTEILPCPFCGSSDTASVSDDKIIWITCTACRSSGPVSALVPVAGKTTWNTRAAQPVADAQAVKPYMWLREENNSIVDYTQDADLAAMWAQDEWPTTRALYTRADAGEVERLTVELGHARRQYQEMLNQAVVQMAERDTLRGQLAERDVLLRAASQALKLSGASIIPEEIESVLSASAEPASERPKGCCCPPKGHTGIWAAAMCPVHFGLRAAVSQKSEGE